MRMRSALQAKADVNTNRNKLAKSVFFMFTLRKVTVYLLNERFPFASRLISLTLALPEGEGEERLSSGRAFVESQTYLSGEQAAGTMSIFSCLTRNSLVAGGQPSTVFDASARSRSRSPPSLYAQT